MRGYAAGRCIVLCLNGYRFRSWIVSVIHCFLMNSKLCLSFRATFKHLALETLVVVMDGSVVGRGCLALMLHVVYKGRALPLAWRVRQSPKGHCPEELHIAMVALLSTVIPKGARVVFVGDGEFDGTEM